MASKRGMGCVYKRGQVYWIKYSLQGRVYMESSQSEKEADAKKLLKKRLGEMADGRFIGPRADKVLLKELCEDLINDYLINGKRSLDKAQRSAKHLLNFFGDARAKEVTTDRVKSYIAKRQVEGMSNAEINRELAALKRAFNLGLQSEKIYRKPYIPMLKEDNIRKGFFEHGEFLAVRDVLPEYLKPVVTFAYFTGWRKSEILGLQWRQVDREAGVVRIDPGFTKGGEGRNIYLEGELRQTIDGQWEKRLLYCPYVFHRAGKPIKDFRVAWERALEETGFRAMLFHDLRRTAVRNMVRAGVPERVAMMISGHKTRSVFDRYNIVSGADLREAARRVEKHNRERTVTETVTVIPFKPKTSTG